MTSGSGALNEKALALFEMALEQERGTRTAWIKKQAGANHALRDKALSYLSRDKMTQGAFHTGGAFHETLDDTAVPERIGAYKITGLIGRGGMGAVYRGERASGDFDHDVAIKVVRPGAMSDKLVARFEAERQTLASLSHPNIARLFDGGTLESGAPYIVMEYIDGLPITEFANKNKLSKTERLALFKAVCSAVSHAHQNLIIHRDITPSNVLVDKEGQVKLIDFGIAKPFDEDAAVLDMEHSLASLSFTPGFAAPERSQGAGANTLSDIYSLGKLLKTLLVSSAQDVELNAVISKATALEPENRYDTVNALKSDIENYTGGFPVNAGVPSPGYKFKKFIGRHKIGTLLAGGAAIGLLGAFAVTLFQYQRAEEALVDANTRFGETRELTSFLIDELSSDLRYLPGTLPIIEKVNVTSSKYLDILATASETDPSVLLDYAKALAQLGYVMMESGGANLSNTEKGLAKIQEGVRILRILESEDPGNADIQFALADALADYAINNMQHRGNFEGMNDMFLESQKYFDNVIRQQPGNVDALRLRARVKLLAINLDVFTGDGELPDFSDIRSEFESLVSRFPDDKRVLPYYAKFLNTAPAMLSESWETAEMTPIAVSEKSKYDQAVKDLTLSAKINEGLLAEEPTNTEHLYNFVYAVKELTGLHGIHTSWMLTDFQLVDAYAQIGNRTGRSGIAKLIKTDERFKQRREIAEVLGPLLDKSDTLLKQIEPYDGASFTHVYGAFYNLKALSIYEAKFRLDLDAGEDYMDQAIAFAEGFMRAQPDFRNAVLETAVSLTEKSYLQLFQQTLYGDDHSREICHNLTRAKALWADGTARWGEIVDYKVDVEMTDHLFEKAGCKR